MPGIKCVLFIAKEKRMGSFLLMKTWRGPTTGLLCHGKRALIRPAQKSLIWGNTLSYSAEKIMQLSNEELYRVLEGLAAETERALATHRCTLESYLMLSESL